MLAICFGRGKHANYRELRGIPCGGGCLATSLQPRRPFTQASPYLPFNHHQEETHFEFAEEAMFKTTQRNRGSSTNFKIPKPETRNHPKMWIQGLNRVEQIVAGRGVLILVCNPWVLQVRPVIHPEGCCELFLNNRGLTKAPFFGLIFYSARPSTQTKLNKGSASLSRGLTWKNPVYQNPRFPVCGPLLPQGSLYNQTNP